MAVFIALFFLFIMLFFFFVMFLMRHGYSLSSADLAAALTACLRRFRLCLSAAASASRFASCPACCGFGLRAESVVFIFIAFLPCNPIKLHAGEAGVK